MLEGVPLLFEQGVWSEPQRGDVPMHRALADDLAGALVAVVEAARAYALSSAPEDYEILCAALDALDALSGDAPELRCVRCRRTPSEIPEYTDLAYTDGDDPDTFVRENEGTLNVKTGLFACTECYIAMGQPANPWPEPRWTP